LAYLTNYLQMYWTDLRCIFRIGRSMGGGHQCHIHFAIAKEVLLWQPLLRQSSKNCFTWPSFIAVEFQNRL